VKASEAPAEGWYPTKAAARSAYEEEHPFKYHLGKGLSSQRRERIAEHATLETAKKVGAATVGHLSDLGGGSVAAGAIAAGTTVAAIAGSALAGWLIGEASRPEVQTLATESRVTIVNQRYREARRELAARLGRTPTKTELRPVTDAWKKALVEAQSGAYGTHHGGLD
jgi:hypothetical protein